MTLPDEVDVYLDAPGGPELVGNLRPSYTGGRSLASASFQYSRAYLDSARAYAVSPDLPLAPGRTFTQENTTIFGAFADASPDEWGQKTLHCLVASERSTTFSESRTSRGWAPSGCARRTANG